MPPLISNSADIFQRLPKVELHRHLEGSIRPDTLREVAQTYGIPLPPNANLQALTQVQDNDSFTFTNFLSKFQVLRGFYCSPEIIQRIVYEAIADAALDQVKYLELRFSPVALSRAKGYALNNVMDWVIQSAKQASAEYGMLTRLVVTINRHESVALAEEVCHLAIERIPQGIVGLDLAGNEAQFSSLPFVDIFHTAKAAGLGITIHAGEWGGAENVRLAIEKFDAMRIGHGVRVLEDVSVVELARQRGVVFEVCPTSNYQSGVVSSLERHPIRRMLEAGLNVTIDTDDPSISRINLTNEYRVFCLTVGLPLEVLDERILAAGHAAFLPEAERQSLVDGLRGELVRR